MTALSRGTPVKFTLGASAKMSDLACPVDKKEREWPTARLIK